MPSGSGGDGPEQYTFLITGLIDSIKGRNSSGKTDDYLGNRQVGPVRSAEGVLLFSFLLPAQLERDFYTITRKRRLYKKISIRLYHIDRR